MTRRILAFALLTLFTVGCAATKQSHDPRQDQGGYGGYGRPAGKR